MIVYYTSKATFSDFHSVHWCNWCYKCHSKLLKQYQCNWCHKMLIDANWMFNVQMFQCSNVSTLPQTPCPKHLCAQNTSELKLSILDKRLWLQWICHSSLPKIGVSHHIYHIYCPKFVLAINLPCFSHLRSMGLFTYYPPWQQCSSFAWPPSSAIVSIWLTPPPCQPASAFATTMLWNHATNTPWFGLNSSFLHKYKSLQNLVWPSPLRPGPPPLISNCQHLAKLSHTIKNFG